MVSAVDRTRTPDSKHLRKVSNPLVPGRSGSRLELDTRHEADVSQVDHIRQPAQRMNGVRPIAFERGSACEQIFAAIELECRETGGCGERMTGVGISVKELDASARAVDDCVVNPMSDAHGAHGHGGIGDPLRDRHHIRQHAEFFGGKRCAEPAKAGDDFVIDQQDAVRIADCAQTLEIPFGRYEHAR